MRIILISDYGYVDGGISRVVFDTLSLLREKRLDVVFVCGCARIDESDVPMGAEVISLNQYDLRSNPSRLKAMLSGIWNAQAKKSVEAILKNYDPGNTVVHVHSWSKIFSPSVFAALRKSGFKTFLTCHDYFVRCPNGAFFDYGTNTICKRKGGGLQCLVCSCDVRSYAQKIWRWVRQQVINRELSRFKELRLVTISKSNDDLIRIILGEEYKRTRINNPMCFPAHAEKAKSGDAFVFAGRLTPEKGPDLFAKAIVATGAKGIVVGEGKSLDGLKKAFPEIDFRGWLKKPELMSLLRDRALAFVFPSLWYETAGLSPLEAMTLGIPCIISDVTSASEYIEDGVTGLLFKSGDVEDLKRKIEMMKDPNFREQMSENIRKYFDISKWSEETHITKLLAAYREALDEVK